MALGNNLKKKKLIPDSKEEEKDSKNVTTGKKSKARKEAPAKKKETAKKAVSKSSKTKTAASKSPTAKKAAPKKSTVKKAKPTAKKKTASSEAKEKVQESKLDTPTQEVTKQELEEIIETVGIESLPIQKTESDSAYSHQNQIISAYSVYIAQELYEKKKTLRKKYIQEVTNLQGRSVQFILLTIGGERYALDIENVKEVVPLPTISKTPNTPNHIKGVANVRGKTYVVFDLSTKFQVKGEEVPRYLLVLANKGLKTSIPLSVLPVTFRGNGNQISHSLKMIEDAQLDASYIKGMIHDGEELIYYLDIVELLKNDKAIVIPDKLVEEK